MSILGSEQTWDGIVVIIMYVEGAFWSVKHAWSFDLGVNFIGVINLLDLTKMYI